MSKSYDEQLNEIIRLMKERDYDPVAQLTGYIEVGSDDYITRHGNAREKIKEIPKDIIEKYVQAQKERR